MPPLPILYAAPEDGALPLPDTTLIDEEAIAREVGNTMGDGAADPDPSAPAADTTQAAAPPADEVRPSEPRAAVRDTLRLTPPIPVDTVDTDTLAIGRLGDDPLDADTLATDTPGPSSVEAPWRMTSLDTLPPTIQRARAQAITHLQVRFTERIALGDRTPDAWTLAAVDNGAAFAVQDVWMHPDSDREVQLETEPLPPGGYVVTPAGVVDRSGNSAPGRPDSLNVDADVPTEAPALRFESFTPEAADTDDQAARQAQDPAEIGADESEAPPPSTPEVLEPDTYPEVQFSRPPAAAALADRIRAADTTGAARTVRPTTTNGTTFELRFDPPLDAGDIVDVTVDPRGLSEDADSLLIRRVQRIPRDDLGSLAGTAVVEEADGPTDIEGPIIVELYRGQASDDETPYRTTEAGSDGTFLFEDLPEDVYRLRLFIDVQGNDRWDGGTITPYRPAEPVRWVEGTEDVRARWETVIDDPIRIPSPRT